MRRSIVGKLVPKTFVVVVGGIGDSRITLVISWPASGGLW